VLKVGIIGYGKMGRSRYHEVIASGKAEVVSVFDSVRIEAKIPCATTADEIIENSTINAVFICTPNYLNKPLTIQALKAGKHVFCEKPPAFTAIEVEEIQAEEKTSGKVLMYGFNHRHHESVQKMKNTICSRDFGRVLWMRGRYGKSVGEAFYNNWRSKKDLAGGGILIDQGIHMLDLFLYLGGEFDSVHATVSNLYWHLEVEDNVFATLENTKTGITASLHSTMTQWRHMFSLEVFMEKGYLVLNGLKTSSGTYGDEVLTFARNRSAAPAATWEDEEHITYHTDKSLSSEIEEFFSAIDNGRRVRIGSSGDALQLMRLVDEIYSFRKETVHG
jgi:1,5-anhydro-D-fructose reductase (1,5-anhydro-D-mannitol-forming)